MQAASPRHELHRHASALPRIDVSCKQAEVSPAALLCIYARDFACAVRSADKAPETRWSMPSHRMKVEKGITVTMRDGIRISL
jgi:hypothetical protein